MKLQLIRNATLKLDYAGHTLLIDPFFGPRHAYQSFTGREKNPTVDLPMPVEAIVQDVDIVIVSHLHNDHFDAAAAAALSDNMPLFCQPGDEGRIREKGFGNVMPIDHRLTWQNILITRMRGQHGSGDVLEQMGKVSGFVLRADNEPTLYLTGDTIFYDKVKSAIDSHQPDIIVTHSGGAVWGEDQTPIVMDAEQTVQLCEYAPEATVIAVHLEALDHCLTTRDELQALAEARGISADRLIILPDGGTFLSND